VGTVVARATRGQVISEYFGFLADHSFHQLLHSHHLTSGTNDFSVIGLGFIPAKEERISWDGRMIDE
jgi:hypothetical protein